MTPDEAILIASKDLEGCTITEIEEYKNVYAVYFLNNEYLKSGDSRDLLIGAGPRIVIKATGELLITGSGKSGLEYAMAYDACGDVYGRLIDSLVLYGTPPSIDKVRSILELKKICEISLVEARQAVNEIIESGSVRFDFDCYCQVEYKVEMLKEKGFKVRQLWSTE